MSVKPTKGGVYWVRVEGRWTMSGFALDVESWTFLGNDQEYELDFVEEWRGPLEPPDSNPFSVGPAFNVPKSDSAVAVLVDSVSGFVRSALISGTWKGAIVKCRGCGDWRSESCGAEDCPVPVQIDDLRP